MLDIEFIRENPDLVKRAAAAKGFEVDLDRLLALDVQRRELTKNTNSVRERLNQLSRRIPSLIAAERTQAVEDVRQLKAQLAVQDSELNQVTSQYNELMLVVPNVPGDDVPPGKSDADNVEVSRWGTVAKFDFEPKDHLELGTALGLFEFDRSRKYAGGRSYSLTGSGVMLERAVIQFALESIAAKGFSPLSPPVMVRASALTATGFFPLGRPDTYAIEDDDLFLVGTSEVSLVAQHADEIVRQEDLPLRYVGVSPCFRREAGAAGRDTKGLYRVHMFTKVEQVSIGPADDDWSRAEHQRILENSCEILRALELPHRVVLVCTAELGLGQVRKHDIETWMPSRATYSETHSCSTLHDFQARRAGIRYRSAPNALKFAYTLNNTAAATPRILIPLLENHQNRDGSVTIPLALRRYMGGVDKLLPVARR
jgi:seryl-tRNA synthetase